MLNYTLFRNVVAPEYADMSDADLDVFANEAECEVSKSAWGCRYDRAVALITAHLIALSKLKSSSDSGQAGTGLLKRVRVGKLEREFENGAGADDKDTYSLTFYGKEYLRLRKQILKGPIFVSC